MAKKAEGVPTFVKRVLSYKTGWLYGLTAEGVVWRKNPIVEWRPWKRFKPHIDPSDFVDKFLSWFPEDRCEINGSLPTMEDLKYWTFDGVCETPCGCRVEPDGFCEHGNKSWLLLLEMV
jgi:hypothetical protein